MRSETELSALSTWLDNFVTSRFSDSRVGFLVTGVATVPIYVALYHILWYFSFDQWFLPVGLRLAWLVFSPRRLLPFFFLADALALLILRVPKQEDYGWTWAVVSPLLVAPLLALVVVPLRTFLARKMRKNPIYLLWVLGVCSAWAALYPFWLNHILSGPSTAESALLGDFALFWLGNYLGMLTIVPAVHFLAILLAGGAIRPTFVLESLGAFCVSIILYLFSTEISEHSVTSLSISTLSIAVLTLPALTMTLRNGYGGAVIGVLSSLLALALFRYRSGIPGYVDVDSLAIDQALAVVATLLLVLGAALTRKVETLRSMGVSEKRALELAQTSLAWAESNLRDRLVYLAQMQIRIDDYRRAVVERLANSGHAAAAMELNSFAVAHGDWFNQHAAALYPARIETDGLYAALHDPAFGDLWAKGSEISLHLRGKPKLLSTSLQVASYRCICTSVAMLSAPGRGLVIIRSRTWSAARRRGISVSVTGSGIKREDWANGHGFEESELRRRVEAFGGRYRRWSGGRVSYTLAEPLVQYHNK